MPSPGFGRQRVAAVSGDDEGNMDNLEEFFKGNEQPEAIEAPAEVVEAPAVEEAVAERLRGPDGKFIPKGEPVEAPESVSPTLETPTLEHPALLGERRRRQEAEDRARVAEERLAARDAQQPTLSQAPSDFWEDPEGYIEATAAALAKEQATQIYQGQILSRSMNKVRGKYEDFNEAAQVFGDMIQRNPDLYDQMLNADEPAEFAYTQAKTEMDLRQYGGLDALVAARVQAALAAQAVPVPVPPAPIPETLADEQSARGSSSQAPLAVKSLDDILGRKG